MRVLGWRNVPNNPDAIGVTARAIMPRIAQLFVSAPDGVEGDDFERSLYLARKTAEKQFLYAETDPETRKVLLREFYVCSWSSRTLIYKGMLTSDQVPRYFVDLGASDYTSHLAMVDSPPRANIQTTKSPTNQASKNRCYSLVCNKCAR